MELQTFPASVFAIMIRLSFSIRTIYLGVLYLMCNHNAQRFSHLGIVAYYNLSAAVLKKRQQRCSMGVTHLVWNTGVHCPQGYKEYWAGTEFV